MFYWLPSPHRLVRNDYVASFTRILATDLSKHLQKAMALEGVIDVHLNMDRMLERLKCYKS